MKRLLLSLLAFTAAALAPAQSPDSLAANDSLVSNRSPQRINRKAIRYFPFRGLENYITVVPGVVRINNEFHVRGSRPYETGFSLDGFNVANPFFGNIGVPIIPEAIDEIDVHTGVLDASIGGMGGGLVATSMRTGGDHLEYFLDLQTDDVVHPGGRFLNTTPQGYKNKS